MALSFLRSAAGLTLIFLVLNVACTAIRKSIEAWMKIRSMMLERAVRELLQDSQGTGLAQERLKHPLIDGLYLGSYKPEDLTAGQRMPWSSSLSSYIPSASFALALLDLDLVLRKPVEDKAPLSRSKACARPSSRSSHSRCSVCCVSHSTIAMATWTRSVPVSSTWR